MVIVLLGFGPTGTPLNVLAAGSGHCDTRRDLDKLVLLTDVMQLLLSETAPCDGAEEMTAKQRWNVNKSI